MKIMENGEGFVATIKTKFQYLSLERMKGTTRRYK